MDDPLERSGDAIEAARQALKEFSKRFDLLPATTGGNESAMRSLYLRIASLANTGLLACTEGEIYAARALGRCIAEHWVRLMSIVSLSTPSDFFGELQEAEAIDIDRRLRNCFPDGRIPVEVPSPARGAIESSLRNPPPTAVEKTWAKDFLQKYQFDKLVRGLLASLKAHDGRDDGGAYGTMAFAYARFSACIHGGPSGHDFLVLSPSAEVVVGTASDLLASWVTALTMVLGKLRGPEHTDTKAALEVQIALFGREMRR